MSKKEIFSQNMINGLGIIQGWKAIGRHIGRSGRTARRWSDNYGMPIRHAITGRPFAFIHELGLWMVKVDDLLKKNHDDERERVREHAAMMRSCKKKKVNSD
jgi:hypothetical protein